MSKKPEIKWQEVNNQILRSLDIEAEYRSLGVNITGNSPSSSGWLQCRAIGREDRSPSAAINVGDDANLRGRYKDLGGSGESLSFWDFAARHGQFGTWQEARRHYAEKAGMLKKLPKTDQESLDQKLDPATWNRLLIRGFLKQYGETNEESVRLCGGQIFKYPKKSNSPQYVIGFPCYGKLGVDSDICGYVIQRTDGSKLSLFRGEGNEHEQVKRATIGRSGIVGLHGLRKLESAEIIWKVEGISDLLAMQAIIPTELRDKHVVITNAGGTHETAFTSEFSPMLAGKCVAVLHDCDIPGQQGAGTWISACKGIAASIKNVVLPFDVTDNHGRDLRDWIRGGGTYDQLLEMLSSSAEMVQLSDSNTEQTTVAKPDSTTSGHHEGNSTPSSIADEYSSLTPEQAALKRLGILVLGEIDGKKTIAAFSQRLGKYVEISDIGKYKLENLIQDFGMDSVKQNLNLGEIPDPSKLSMAFVRQSIASEGGKKRLQDSARLGVGIWQVNERIVIVNSGDFVVLNGQMVRSSVPEVGGKLIDFAGSTKWFSFEELESLYKQSESREWCEAAFNESSEIFARWDNWVHEDTPQLLTALVACTWLQTAWSWRPGVAVCGPSNCGKTVLFEDCIAKMFGGLGSLVSKSSEAGIRQMIRHTAKILLIDEFEHDKHRSAILELFRTSSRGTETVRGTASQSGARYGLKHIPWIASIEIGLKRAPDANRYIIFELAELDKSRGSTLVIPSEEECRSVGMKLLAVALRHFRKTKDISERLKTHVFRGADRRLVESFSLPCSMLAAIFGFDESKAVSMMDAVLSKRDLSEQGEKDEALLIQEIYESVVQVSGGKQATISELLSDTFNDPGWLDALTKSGVRPVSDATGRNCIFFVKASIKRYLLRNTDFGGQDINQILMRIKGAERSRQKMGGHFPRGIMIPADSINSLFEDSGIKISTATDTEFL